MIIGGHSIIYSTNPEADRAFFRDVLKLSNVDTGGGWLIFGLPPAEVAFHPSEKNDLHEFYLIVDNVETFIDDMSKNNIVTGPLQTEEWGLLTQLTLPGGGKLGVYEPRHARPKPITLKPAKTAAKKRSMKSVVERRGRAKHDVKRQIRVKAHREG